LYRDFVLHFWKEIGTEGTDTVTYNDIRTDIRTEEYILCVLCLCLCNFLIYFVVYPKARQTASWLEQFLLTFETFLV
jgi:hypothetical protein